MKILPVVFMALMCSVNCSYGGDTDEAREFVQKAIKEVLGILAEKPAPDEMAGHNAKLDEIVDRVFNAPLMAKLTLGRTNWGKFSEVQQAEFEQLFVKQLKASYLSKASMFSDQKVTVGEAKQNGSKIVVESEAVSDTDKIALLYKLHKDRETNSWKVYDVEISGVSIIASHRTEYGDLLSRMSVEEFLEKLRAKVEDGGNE